MEVASSKEPITFAEGNALNIRLTGEAVAIEIPGGQTLFALVGQLPNGKGELANAVTLAFEPRHTGPESFLAAVKKLGRKDQLGRAVELPRDKYPMLVTFRDVDDPKTVEAVDPENLANRFGPGIKIRGISVQIVDEALTTGIEKKLSWWTKYRDRQLDGQKYNNSPSVANTLNRSDFKQGNV